MREKNDRDRLIALAERHPDYALGFQDEVWWSRVTQPNLHAWVDEEAALRLVEQTAPKDGPDRKALACYGLLVSCPAAPTTLPEQVGLRFVEDRPISAVTTQYLAWCCDKLTKLGKKALLMIWDSASWHISQEVRSWIRDHNRAVKQQGADVQDCHPHRFRHTFVVNLLRPGGNAFELQTACPGVLGMMQAYLALAQAA